MKQRLLVPLMADLALFLSERDNASYLESIAQYNWTYPELDDWGVVMDTVVQHHCPGVRWEGLCDVRYQYLNDKNDQGPWGQFLGGVSRCEHIGSAGILLALRYLLQKKLQPLVPLYDWFIVSRADELYLCDHVPMLQMQKRRTNTPIGGDCGGISDRHQVFHQNDVMKALNVTVDLLCRAEYWIPFFHERRVANLEIVLYFLLHELPQHHFTRTMFTVRAPGDPTRWSQGVYWKEGARFNLTIKYPDEYAETTNCATIKQLEVIS
jgi:hypothetical protein